MTLTEGGVPRAKTHEEIMVEKMADTKSIVAVLLPDNKWHQVYNESLFETDDFIAFMDGEVRQWLSVPPSSILATRHRIEQ